MPDSKLARWTIAILAVIGTIQLAHWISKPHIAPGCERYVGMSYEDVPQHCIDAADDNLLGKAVSFVETIPRVAFAGLIFVMLAVPAAIFSYWYVKVLTWPVRWVFCKVVLRRSPEPFRDHPGRGEDDRPPKQVKDARPGTTPDVPSRKRMVDGSSEVRHEVLELKDFQPAQARAASPAAPPTTPGDNLLTTAEVAVLFKVESKTVLGWVRAGEIAAERTNSGHHRFHAVEVRRFVERLGDNDR